ncbi:MAG: hypothetical protein ABEI13_00765 [Candidatus Paceibacteria bacterium]
MRRNTENTVRKIGKSSTGDVFMEVRGRVLQNNPLIVGDHVDSIRVDGFHPMAFSKDSVVNIRGPLVNSAIQAEEFTVIDY